MKFILSVIVFIAAAAVGTFGFAQIIGSLQNIKKRGLGMTLFTIILWSAILLGSYLLMKRIVPAQRTAYFIGLGISFIMTLSAGKIQ